MTQKNRMIQMSQDSVIVGGKYVSTHYDVRIPLPYPLDGAGTGHTDAEVSRA